jgi:hypothetical protein
MVLYISWKITNFKTILLNFFTNIYHLWITSPRFSQMTLIFQVILQQLMHHRAKYILHVKSDNIKLTIFYNDMMNWSICHTSLLSAHSNAWYKSLQFLRKDSFYIPIINRINSLAIGRKIFMRSELIKGICLKVIEKLI